MHPSSACLRRAPSVAPASEEVFLEEGIDLVPALQVCRETGTDLAPASCEVANGLRGAEEASVARRRVEAGTATDVSEACASDVLAASDERRESASDEAA